MCDTCWDEFYGSPAIDSPTVREGARLVADLYELSPVGGRAHIVTDDWNLEDHMIDWCLAQPYGAGAGATPEAEAAADAVLKAFRGMSVDERASALALFDGFWGRDDAS